MEAVASDGQVRVTVMPTLDEMANRLGGEVRRLEVHAPGPNHSPEDRSMSVQLSSSAPHGLLIHSFAGDSYRDCLTHVLERLDNLNTSDNTSYQPIKRTASKQQETKPYALKIWNESRTINLTPAEVYCHFRVPSLDMQRVNLSALRYHSNCPFMGKIYAPALICLFSDIFTNEPLAIQRIAIKENGRGKADMPNGNAPKQMLGSVKGAAVKLSPIETHKKRILAIAEGVETALSLIAIGFSPVWAVGSKGGILKFPVIAGVEHLLIFPDHDENGGSQMTAEACAKRYEAAGKIALVITPQKLASDWNDVVVEAYRDQSK